MPRMLAAILGATVVIALIWTLRPEQGADDQAPLLPDVVTATEVTSDTDVDHLSPASLPENRKTLADVDAEPTKGEQDVVAANEFLGKLLPSEWVARGVVLDPTGEPVAGLRIERAGNDGEVVAETGGDGRFEVSLKSDGAVLTAVGDGYRTVFSASAARHLSDLELVIMVAPLVRLEGAVIDADGSAISNATMSMEVPMDGIVGFPRSMERSNPVELDWELGEGGKFDLSDVPILGNVSLSTVAEGFNPQSTAVPGTGAFGVVVRLQRVAAAAPEEESAGHHLFGVVQDSGGQPVAGADIFLGEVRTQSDEAGRWEFSHDGSSRYGLPLAAIHGSGRSAMLPFDGAWFDSKERIGPLVLVLGPSNLAIAGRIVDSEGAPLTGWFVDIQDPTYLSGEMSAPTVERGGTARLTGTRSGEDGRFRIEGLLDRAYHIRAHSSEPYLSIANEEVQAGTQDLELRLPKDALMKKLRVRVVTRDGLAVAGATVTVRFIFERSRSGFMSRPSATGITDSEGRVTLESVPRRGVSLVTGKPGTIPKDFNAPDEGFPDEEVRIEVDRSLEFVVDCSAMTPVPSAVRIVDEHDKALMITSRTANGSRSSSSLNLEGGVSTVVSVSESAREMVILESWEERERVAVELVPGTITRIEVP